MSERIAIVVGAGGELGRATAEKLAAAGFTVVGIDRSEEGLKELPDGIRREVADPVDPVSARSVIDRIAAEVGPPEVLVNTIGMLVDGNDAAAVYAAVRGAVASGAEGGGPTLIEALTYRIEAHTNADDATRYRGQAEVDGWLARDPLARLRKHLIARGLLEEPAVAALDAEAEAEAAALRQRVNADIAHDPADLFRHVYAEQTPDLRWQQQELSAELAAAADDPEAAR